MSKKKSMFAKKEKGLEKEKDFVPGGTGLQTGVLPYIVKNNFYWVADSGAKMMTLEFENPESGKTLKTMQCINSKAGKNYYVRNGKKFPLPSYTVVNDLTNILLGKDIEDLEPKFKNKKVKVWDPKKGKEVVKSMPVLTKMNGKKIYLALAAEAHDKPARDSKGKIVYKKNKKTKKLETVPSGEFFVETVIRKVLDEKQRTVNEIEAKLKKGEFAKKFDKYQKGRIADRTVGKKWTKKEKKGKGKKKGKKNKDVFK